MSFESNAFIGTMALVCCISSSVLSLMQIRDHLQHNPLHTLRVFVNRILLMVPVYAITAYVAFKTSRGTIVWDTVRDCYEAFVIYSFFEFLCESLGGQSRIIERLACRPVQKHIAPFNCLPTWSMGDQFYHRVKWGILQYVVVKLAVTLIAPTLWVFGVFHDGRMSPDDAFFWISGLNSLSQLWAVYCLVLFYVQHKQVLKPIKPIPKFLCIKGIIFFTFWQKVFVQILFHFRVISGTNEDALKLQDLIICFEMLGFAFVHRYAFAPSDFWNGLDQSPALVTRAMLASLISAGDIFASIRSEWPVPSRSPEGQVMKDNTARVFVARDPALPYHSPSFMESPERVSTLE